MNLVLLTFSLFTSAVVITSTLLNTLEKRLPDFFSKNLRYGKFGVTSNPSKHVIEVPKSWFKHFYIIALFVFLYGLYMVTNVYIFNNAVPTWFIHILNVTCGHNRVETTSLTKTYIAFSLLTLQAVRRFYDTHFVSVFSPKGRISLLHYFMGVFHYPGCALAILCEASKFTDTSLPPLPETFSFANVSKADIAVTIVFMWAWWHQHVTSKILANLRRDKRGIVVSESHKVPNGDWFSYLTAPHQTAEIIMYIALTILLRTNFTWFIAFTWVLSNQIQTILLTHWWYQEKFEDFPKNRKALIPFVY